MQSFPRSKRIADGSTRLAARLLRAALAAALTLGVAQAWGTTQAGAAEPSAPSSEAAADNQRKAQSIARQTMSPFCPGRTLADCPSEHAAAWRRDIQAMLDQGRTAQEIQEEFERRAGSDLSGSPNRAAGYGLSLGLAVASLAVLYGLLHLLRSRKQPSEERPAGAEASSAESKAPAVTDPKLDERLDRELAEELDDDD